MEEEVSKEEPKKTPIYRKKSKFFWPFIITILISLAGLGVDVLGVFYGNFAIMELGLLIFVVGVMLEIVLHLEDQLDHIKETYVDRFREMGTLLQKFKEQLSALDIRLESLEEFSKNCGCFSGIMASLLNRSDIGKSLEQLMTNLGDIFVRRGTMKGVVDMVTAEVIDSMADEVRHEMFIVELKYYTEWIEKAIDYFISKNGRGGHPEAFCTSLLTPSEWKKGIDGGIYRVEFKAYKELFEKNRDKLKTSRVLLMSQEQMKNEDERITAEFIRDHEQHGITLLFFDTIAAEKDSTLDRFVTDFVTLYDDKESITIHIATKKIMRYVPIEILDKSSLSFQTFHDARQYFYKKGVCEPASEVFERCFGKSYQAALRKKKWEAKA